LGSTHPPQHDYGRVDAYQYCEGFRFQDLLQTQGVSLEITNLFIEDIMHIGVMRELRVMMVILMIMQTLEMKMRETVVMREVYVMRIKMASHQPQFNLFSIQL
jgi:hypothetical protein